MLDNDSLFPLCLKYLSDLIHIDTVNPPGNEVLSAEYIHKSLSQYGINSEIVSLGDNRANLITDQISEGIPVIFSGHMDVVPIGEGWETDPFIATENGGLIYGRGACDMKGGIACMMAAAVWASKREDTLPFRLVFVADEEIRGKGTHAYLDQYAHGEIRYVIIGEPTTNQLHIAHRGAMRFHITLHGVSCHAGTPENGVNPIENASIVLRAIQEVNKDFQKRKQGVLPPSTVCCTMISAGIKDNVVPDECIITIDCRPCFGDTPQIFIEAIKDKIKALGDLPEGIHVDYENYISGSAGGVESNSPIVQWATEKYIRAFHHDPVITSFPACCDLHHFTDAGFPAILYGPGSIRQAHTANEYVSIDELRKAFDFYCSCMIE